MSTTLCVQSQQGCRKDTDLASATTDPGPGRAGGWAWVSTFSQLLKGIPAGGAAGSRVTVEQREVAMEGQGWPRLYPQAWPRPVLGVHLAPLFMLGPLGDGDADGGRASCGARVEPTSALHTADTDKDGSSGMTGSVPSRPEAAVSRGCCGCLPGSELQAEGWTGTLGLSGVRPGGQRAQCPPA